MGRPSANLDGHGHGRTRLHSAWQLNTQSRLTCNSSQEEQPTNLPNACQTASSSAPESQKFICPKLQITALAVTATIARPWLRHRRWTGTGRKFTSGKELLNTVQNCGQQTPATENIHTWIETPSEISAWPTDLLLFCKTSE